MLNDEGMRMRMSCAAVMVGVAASVTVIGLPATGGCPMTKTWFAAVMVGVAASVIVIALIAVAACPTRKSWSAADAIVGCTIWMVRLSLAFAPPPGPVTTSCR